jgi:hypothetical protein
MLFPPPPLARPPLQRHPNQQHQNGHRKNAQRAQEQQKALVVGGTAVGRRALEGELVRVTNAIVLGRGISAMAVRMLEGAEVF